MNVALVAAQHANAFAYRGQLGKHALTGLVRQISLALGKEIVRPSALLGRSALERAEVEALVKRGIDNGVKGVRLVEKDELQKISCTILSDVKGKRFLPNAVVCQQKNAIRKIVRQRLKNGEYTPFEQVLPFYIAVSQAEKDLQK